MSAVTTAIGLVAAKTALKSIDTFTFNAYLFAIGAAVTFGEASVSRNIGQAVRITSRQFLFVLMLAVVFCIAMFMTYSALAHAEPATVSFISRLELAVTIILAAIFLKERMNPAEILGLILVAAGLFVMRYQASFELSQAIVLVALASVLTGLAEVTIKSWINWISDRCFVLYRNTIMAAIFIIAGLVTGRLSWISNFTILGLMLIAGICMPYLGRIGYLKAMRNINISRASIVTQSQPFFAAAAALIFLGTFPSPKEIIGGLLIVAGVVAIRLLEARAQQKRSDPAVSSK
jgi:drug/metabolite transporter (DMT)-like permease